MDHRRILEPGTELLFPGMECRIDSLLGKGSNAIVYVGSYSDRELQNLRHKVLIKELFPFDERGRIYRGEGENVCGTKEVRGMMDLHRLSFLRGNEVHLKLLDAYPEDIDTNINTFSLHQTLYSVLSFSGGRSLAHEMERKKLSSIPLTEHVRRIVGVLNVLEAFHRSGYLHLDISPDNILLIGDGRRERISLIDYNSVHTLREIRQGEAVYYSAKEGYTAPEIRMEQVGLVGYPSDLYALTAVFYQLITGERLTVLQTVRGKVPDVSEAPCLTEMPDTVHNMVRKILKHGLTAIVSKRYQSIDQMRRDLEELQDRIEGKGITHAALWETGRSNIFQAISSNPSLGYIRENEKIYPVLCETAQGETFTIDQLINKTVSNSGSSVFLLGGGGAGKTTALMRAAYVQPRKYSSTEPAFTYISLYGWSERRSSYIKDMILERLRFKPDTESIEMASHELLRMLSKPILTTQDERPRLVILLDGLNEASGDTKGLLQEILELSELRGVRFLLTGRSDIEEIAFPRITLRPLEKAEVRKILGDNGVLMPKQDALSELLRSPMMLSIYIKAVLDQEKQLFIETKEQLLDNYFAAIRWKETRGLPEDSGERWQIEAVLSYILPEIAAHTRMKRRVLSDREMFRIVEKCYRRLKQRSATKIFPEWIGHFAEICGEAADAEAWYGLMVHGLLWRRLGLVVRDEQGRYRIAHQLFEEYLVQIQKGFGRKFLRYEITRNLINVIIWAMCFVGVYQLVYRPYFLPEQEEEKVYYDVTAAENVLDAAFVSYIVCANQYREFSQLVDCCMDENENMELYNRSVYNCRSSLQSEGAVNIVLAEGYLQRLYGSGEVMPWSGQPFAEDIYLELIALPEKRGKEYAEYLDVLTRAREDGDAWEFFDGEDYVKKLDALLEADARLLGKYFNMIIGPELTAMERSASEEEQQNYKLYMKSYALVPEQNKITRDSVEDVEVYREDQKSALRYLMENGLSRYMKSLEG